jgi:hypothetical protein
MNDIGQDVRIRARRDDLAAPCGCFASSWNTPEDYDEDLAPIQCFPQAFPFSLFQSRLPKRSSQKPIAVATQTLTEDDRSL